MIKHNKIQHIKLVSITNNKLEQFLLGMDTWKSPNDTFSIKAQAEPVRQNTPIPKGYILDTMPVYLAPSKCQLVSIHNN